MRLVLAALILFIAVPAAAAPKVCQTIQQQLDACRSNLAGCQGTVQILTSELNSCRAELDVLRMPIIEAPVVRLITALSTPISTDIANTRVGEVQLQLPWIAADGSSQTDGGWSFSQVAVDRYTVQYTPHTVGTWRAVLVIISQGTIYEYPVSVEVR